MKLSTHFLVAACAGGLTTAEILAPKECRWTDLSLNATNADALANCTLYTYQCHPNGNNGNVTYATTPPANCPETKRFSLSFTNFSMTGPLVVPRIVKAHIITIHGNSHWSTNWSDGYPTYEARNLLVDSVDFPDLVNVTVLSVKSAPNVASLNFPKVENVSALLDIDLLAGPAINLSFPSLRDARTIVIAGKIDALDFPVLNSERTISITTTGDLDCEAFAATYVNKTKWPTGDPDMPQSLSCISTEGKGNIKTHPVPANDTEDTKDTGNTNDTENTNDTNDTSGSSGVSWFRADLLFLVVLVGGASLVV